MVKGDTKMNKNAKKTTEAQARLLSKLPELFYLLEDYTRSDSPPTIIHDLDGREVYRFTRGDSRAFYSLAKNGRILRLSDEKPSEVARRFYTPYGKC